jgi:sulfite reductase beta subunit-like hemoprotein
VAERDFSPRLFSFDEAAAAPPVPREWSSPNGDASEFERFVTANVRVQRQSGFSTVEVKVPRGDLTPEQLRGLATITRRHSGGFVRTTIQQNLVLRWVRDESTYEVWNALAEIGLAGVGPRSISDVVSCPGTDSCKLGITSSMGLNQAISERVEAMAITDSLTQRIHIKVSGCPNGCGQHHIANIGFTGAAIKVGDRSVPAYIPHLAGHYENGEVLMGHRLKARLPSKRVPEAVERWLRHYERERSAGEEFNAFVQRVGTDRFESIVKDLALPPDFSLETMTQFIDWSRAEPFEVIRGEGECAV